MAILVSGNVRGFFSMFEDVYPPQKTNISAFKGLFPKVGYVSFLEGNVCIVVCYCILGRCMDPGSQWVKTVPYSFFVKGTRFEPS